MTILGIDLGTTNSIACVYRNNECIPIPNNFNELLTPSVVSLNEDGTIIVGKIAKERLITNPQMTIANFKRYMGTNEVFTLGAKKFTAEELSSFVLRKLIDDAREFLQEEIDEIIVSVPAYFNDDQRWATKAAGMLAGVKIDRIINEPSAAALSIHQESLEEKSYMVIDFGGGTLDVSIVDAFDNVIEIIAVAGDNKLGGEDFNHLIALEFLKSNNLNESDLNNEELEKLYKQAEQCKRLLNDNEEVTMNVCINKTEYKDTLTYERFSSLCQSLLIQMEVPISKALMDASMKLDKISDIVLVGGSCKMKVVNEYLCKFLNTNTKIEANPDLAIAYGCGIIAAIKERQKDIKDVVLTDICPFTLGIKLNNDMFSSLIERNTSLPCSREKPYSSLNLGQSSIVLEIYQGENMKASRNLKLGELNVEIPVNYIEREGIIVRFTYDINGLLDIDVLVNSTRERKNLIIVGQSNKMSHEQINARLIEMSKLKIHPRDLDKNKFILERANIVFSECMGIEREYLSAMANEFYRALETQDTRIIDQKYDAFDNLLNRYERKNHSDMINKGLLS